MKKFIIKYHKDIIFITLILISLLLTIFYFKIPVIRFKESMVDLYTTAINYFCNLFDIGYNGATVKEYSLVDYPMPFGLPRTWEEFKELFKNYWDVFFSKEAFLGYFGLLIDILYYLSQIILILSGPILILIIINVFKKKEENNKHNKKSKYLWKFINFEKKVYVPFKEWVKSFIQYFNEHEYYKPLLILIWCWNFNIIVIILELIAYYFYFVASFDLLNLYVQILKLLMDLSVAYNFIPGLIKIILLLIVINIIRKNLGYDNLNHFENRNKGFINELPIISFGYGTMGVGKTKLVTDMALSQEAIFRSKAFELMLDCDLKFPNFPWINLENILKQAIEEHKIYNLATTEKYIKELEKDFIDIELNTDKAIFKSIIRNMKKRQKYPFNNLLFDYNYQHYDFYFDNNLKVESIWDVILDYSKLYFIYVINTSLIVSNYAIRSDNIKLDKGNFPLWNLDFFTKETKYQNVYSKHSHVLDYDMFRLGKKVADSKFSNTFEFGVINISEVGKERKNSLVLQSIKASDSKANQKNDLFESDLKMIRHRATIMNYCFVKLFTEEQRPESWGADARDLCELVFIDKQQEKRLAMPLFFIEEILYAIIYKNYDHKYYQRRYERGDITLWMYIKHNIMSKIHNYYKKIYNTFGYTKLNIELESGRMDDTKPIEKNYYIMDKKIYSNRYSTDCYSSFFKYKASKSDYGIMDLPEYKNTVASTEEMKQQNSYFYNDLTNMFNVENDI